MPPVLAALVALLVAASVQALVAPARRMMMHFDEAGSGSLRSGSLPAARYLATNRFKVRPGAEARFEKRWAERKSRLAVLPGFRFFSLFRRIALPGMPGPDADDVFNYVSFTIWETKDNFDAWRSGEAFKEAHGGGGIMDFIKLVSTALFIVDGSPKPAFYDALLVQQGERLSFASDEGWRSIKADGENLLPAETLMTMNRFRVAEGKELDFERMWSSRESRLKEVPGFVGFSLLRRDASKADDGFNYISCTIWRDKESFAGWRSSEAFKAAHAGAGEGTKDMYSGPPSLAVFEGALTLASPLGIADAAPAIDQKVFA